MADVSGAAVVAEEPLTAWSKIESFGKSAYDYGSKAASYTKDASLSIYEKAKDIPEFFSMDEASFAFVLVIALTGISALLTTYDYLTDIDKDERGCADTDPLKSKLNSKFWVTLSVGIVVLFFGIIMAFLVRKKKSKALAGFVISVILLGSFAVLYAIKMQINMWSSTPKLLTMWGLFIVAVVAAIAHRWYVNSRGKTLRLKIASID